MISSITFPRRTLAIAVLTAVSMGGMALPARAATDDATQCVIGLTIPSKVAIDGDTTSVVARLTDPTRCATFSNWTFGHNGGYAGGGAQFDRPATSDRVQMDTSISGWTPGVYYAFGMDAATDKTYFDSAGNELFLGVQQEQSNHMTLKYASTLKWTSAGRRGAYVTLAAAARRWEPTYVWMPPHVEGSYVPWSRPVAQVQTEVKGIWRTVRTVRASRQGVVSVRLRDSRRKWRIVTADSGSVWGASTAAKTR